MTRQAIFESRYGFVGQRGRSARRRSSARRWVGFEHLEQRAMLAVTLEASPLTIAEAGGVSTITARLSQTNTQAVTVNLGVAGTATQNTDFTLSSAQITIPAGSLTGTATLTGSADTVADNNENAIISITSVTNDTESGDQSVTVRLAEDAGTSQLMGFVRVDVDGDRTLETTDNGMAGLVVNLSGTTAMGSIGLTAMTGDDGRFGFTQLPAGTYTLTLQNSSGVLFGTHQLGSAGGTISGQTISGIQLEPGESASGYQFGVKSIAPPFVSLRFFSTNQGTVAAAYRDTLATAAERSNQPALAAQIRGGETEDNPAVVSAVGDNLPVIAISSSATSIAEAGGTSTITATLSAAATQAVTINLQFTGTATETTDYTRSVSQITIAAGQTTGTLTLTGVNDTQAEGNETIVVTAVSAFGAVVGSANAVTVTVTDDESTGPPQVSLSASAASVAENGSPVTLTATLSRAATSVVLVDIGFTGTATRGTDYQATVQQISIPVGQTTGTLTITPLVDNVDEPNETIQAEITAVTGAEEQGTQSVTISLQDTNSSPTVTLSSSSDEVSEAGGMVTITATLSQASGQAVTVPLNFTGTAAATADYTRSATTITIAAGQLSNTITITAVEDTIDETDETIIVTIGQPTGANPGTTNSVTIEVMDNDMPRVELTTEKNSLAENGDQAILRAVLVTPMPEPVTVNLAVAGTATTDVDYSINQLVITIPANQLSGQVTITSINDQLDENDETVIVSISSVTGASPGTVNSMTFTIGDDDPEPTVTLSADTTELVEEGTAATLTATLSAASARDVTVTLTLSGTATETDDYTLSADEIVIPAGQTSATVTVTPVNDTLDEVDESIVVDVGTVENGVESGTQRVEFNLNDNDAAPEFLLTTSAEQINEAAGTVTLTGTLSAASALEVVVALDFAGTATNETDYTRSGVQMTFAPGETTRTITLTGVQDTDVDPGETIVVTVADAENALDVTPDDLTITIIDDESAAQQALAAAVDEAFEDVMDPVLE